MTFKKKWDQWGFAYCGLTRRSEITNYFIEKYCGRKICSSCAVSMDFNVDTKDDIDDIDDNSTNVDITLVSGVFILLFDENDI